jgi:hypothetical protein
MLTAALPLSSEEKKIAPASRTALTAVETFIGKQIGAIKTPAAIASFWSSLSGWANRNQMACGTITAAPGTTTKAKPAGKSGIKTRTAKA